MTGCPVAAWNGMGWNSEYSDPILMHSSGGLSRKQPFYSFSPCDREMEGMMGREKPWISCTCHSNAQLQFKRERGDEG